MNSYLSSFIVGSVFLVTGVAKALEFIRFRNHIARLQLVSNPRILDTMTIVFCIIECVVGTALILHIMPGWFLPSALMLLIILTGVTVWSTSTKRTSDCGCYGGLAELSPAQSLLLNLAYMALLGFAWFYPVPTWFTPLQQVFILLLTVLISAGLALGAYRYWYTRQKPLLDLTPLRVNRRWQPQWLDADAVNDGFMHGTKIIVFLRPNCPACKIWVKLLKLVHKHDDFPEVVGAFRVDTPEDIDAFVHDYQVNFPVVTLDPTQSRRLVAYGFPIAVVLEAGVIREKWLLTMPLPFVIRIKQVLAALQPQIQANSSSLS